MGFLVFGVTDKKIFQLHIFLINYIPPRFKGVLAVGLFAADTKIGSTSGRVGLFKGTEGQIISIVKKHTDFSLFSDFISTHHNHRWDGNHSSWLLFKHLKEVGGICAEFKPLL